MKKLFYVIVYLLVLCSCKNDSTANFIRNEKISVELKHPYATGAFLLIQKGEEISELQMNKMADNKFELSFEFENEINYWFNIKLVSSLYPGHPLWVGRPIGIDAVSVSLNETILSENFLVKTGELVASNEVPSAAFSIIKKPSSITAGPGTKWDPDPRLPPEIPQYHNYCRLSLPPNNFTAGLPWMQALHNGHNTAESKVEVEYLRFYARTSTEDILLFSEDYSVDQIFAGYEHGGTYLRHPFFYDEANNNWQMPAKINNGCLIINPGLYKDKVFHWWLPERLIITEDALYVYAEAKVRIIGDACVQLAIDFWKDLSSPYAGKDVNNTEAGVSNFIFESQKDEWQVITFSTEHLVPWKD